MQYFHTKTSALDFDTALEKIEQALQQEGFGVLTNIDIQATLQKKLGVEFRKYKILGACNPPFAYKALSVEPHLGVLLPCNVVVQENTDGKVIVSTINPLNSMQSVGNPSIQEVAEDINKRLLQVLAKI